MLERPMPITVIAWFLIICSVVAVFFISIQFAHPAAFELMLMFPHMLISTLLLCLASVLTLVLAVGFLKGWRWTRWVYAGSSVLSLIVALLMWPLAEALWPAVPTALILYILFSPKANEFFAQHRRAGLQEATDSSLLPEASRRSRHAHGGLAAHE